MMQMRGTNKLAADLLLVLDRDEESSHALREISVRLGCDILETRSVEEMRRLFEVRVPTIAVLAIDRLDDGEADALDEFAQLCPAPAVLLVGSVHPRVLASAARTAVARGLHVIGAIKRPVDLDATERLLEPHLGTPPPIDVSELEQALLNFEFTLQYQPKVSICGGSPRIQAVEALLRWTHPRRGVLYPRQFLAAIEQHSLMTRVTDYVMTEAVRQAGLWRRRGLCPEMIVNLSPHLVRDRAFPDRLAILLQENDVPASQFVIDVAEASGGGDRDLMLDVFTRLRILGIGLCLDNFGTGLSSLTDLYRMPFSEIKLDQTLIADISREREARLVIGAFTDLAHTLQLAVCAAGIENRQTYECVRSLGIDSAQGRFFSPPVNVSDVERLLESWPRVDFAATGPWPVRSRSEFKRITASNDSLPPVAIAKDPST
jgi:EAL domain-containing protein (putative c-di-GMP-specific phosphodiesterase class I)